MLLALWCVVVVAILAGIRGYFLLREECRDDHERVRLDRSVADERWQYTLERLDILVDDFESFLVDGEIPSATAKAKPAKKRGKKP